MRIIMSVLLGVLATLVAILAIVGGWYFGIFLVDWMVKIGPISIAIGCAVAVLFLSLTKYFYEHVVIEESE